MKQSWDRIPFGAQYYRAPTPAEESWEPDLAAFASKGFNTVKLWLQWRWNEPAEGEYYFDDIDRLLGICERNGLKVILNIICDVAPAWFMRKYPESLMVTNGGQKLYPQTTAYRQIGGCPGPCLNHPEGIRARRQFCEKMSEHFGGSDAILAWDLWNEPELTVGLKRKDNAEDLVCYCDSCVNKFRRRLKERFGSIEALNGRWGRNYRSFDEVEAPRCGATFLDMIDWRMFFIDTVAEETEMRAQAVKKFDKAHPVMVHTVPMPFFNVMTSGSCDSLLAEKCDLFGNSVSSFPFSAAQTTAAAPGKTVIASEIHAIGGSTIDRPSIPSPEDFKRHIFAPLGLGIKGFLFWQYRPELLGLESPAWGLTAADGGDTPWLGYASSICAALQRHAGPLLRAYPAQPQIAVVACAQGEAFSWCATGSVELHQKSVEGAFRAFFESNVGVDVIDERQVAGGCLTKYRAVYYPFPYFVNGEIATALKEYVAGGGTLISEAVFGGVSGDDNLHAKRLPGFGFEKVFGTKEGRVLTGSVFTNSYGERWAEEQTAKMMTLTGSEGETAKGYFFCEELICDGSEPVARFDDGRIAATAAKYGKGNAIWIGSLPAYAYDTLGDSATRVFLLGLAARFAGVHPAAVSKAHVDLLEDGGAPAFCVISDTAAGGEADIEFTDPAMAGKTLVDLMTGARHTVSSDPSHPRLRLPMAPGGIDCFSIE